MHAWTPGHLSPATLEVILLFPHIQVIYSSYLRGLYNNLKNSLIIQEQNTKKNHKRVVVLYVIKNHVNLHKL